MILSYLMYFLCSGFKTRNVHTVISQNKKKSVIFYGFLTVSEKFKSSVFFFTQNYAHIKKQTGNAFSRFFLTSKLDKNSKKNF